MSAHEKFCPIFVKDQPIMAGFVNLYTRTDRDGNRCSHAGWVRRTREEAIDADRNDVSYARVRIIPKVPA